eukprot:174679-Prorocentrum_minimum.AAC.1
MGANRGSDVSICRVDGSESRAPRGGRTPCARGSHAPAPRRSDQECSSLAPAPPRQTGRGPPRPGRCRVPMCGRP